MTNGEKLDQVFPDGICPFSKNWLDYEYKEPTTKNDLSSGLENVSPIIDWNKCHTSEQLNSIATTKNDLGVDCISRADVLKLMQDNWHTHNGDWAMQESMDDIRALPSVTPQEPRWIPVSEYLPVTNDEVLVTYIVNGNAKKRYVETANCFDGEWSSVNDEYRIPNTKIEIIAWCEMPKPYKAEVEPHESEET